MQELSKDNSEALFHADLLGMSQSEYSDNTGDDAFKNRRSRVSSEQLSYLMASFQSNPSPNCKVRTMISKRLDLPERTIQIWFQNRRAKAKNAQRKAHMALQEQALSQHYLATRTDPFGSMGGGGEEFAKAPQNQMSLADFTPPSSTNISNAGFSPLINQSPFPYNSLTSTAPAVKDFTQDNILFTTTFSTTVLAIGTWQRMPLNNEGLSCGYNLTNNSMSWIISDNGYKFRIHFLLNGIERLEMFFRDHLFAEIQFDLNICPSFSVFNNGSWVPCADFTEDCQASKLSRHTIKGDAQALRLQFLRLIEHAPSLTSKAFIHPTVPKTPLTAIQMDARRRQSTTLLTANPMSQFETLGTQFMANSALERYKNRSLSLPSIENPASNYDNSLLQDTIQNFDENAFLNLDLHDPSLSLMNFNESNFDAMNGLDLGLELQ